LQTRFGAHVAATMPEIIARTKYSDPRHMADDGLTALRFDPPENLLSPPHNWPECFKESTLKAFIGKSGLKGKRCRLTATPNQSACTAASGIQQDGDSFDNATRLQEHLGWTIVKGFAVFELREPAGSYCAVQHWWNADETGVWVDMTPRAAGQAELVLVETALGEELGAPKAPEPAATKEASPVAPRAEPVKINFKTALEREADETKKILNRFCGLWKVYRGIRNGRMRLNIFADHTFQLEVECWNKQFDEDEYEDDFFTSVDDDDDDAAQLRCTGEWRGTLTNINFTFDSVEELGPGSRRLAVQAREIYDHCGKELGRLLYCGVDKYGTAIQISLGANQQSAKKTFLFEKM